MKEALAARSARNVVGHRGQLLKVQRKYWPRSKTNDSFGATFEPLKRVLLLMLPKIDCDRLPNSLISTKFAFVTIHSDSFKDPCKHTMDNHLKVIRDSLSTQRAFLRHRHHKPILERTARWNHFHEYRAAETRFQSPMIICRCPIVNFRNQHECPLKRGTVGQESCIGWPSWVDCAVEFAQRHPVNSLSHPCTSSACTMHNSSRSCIPICWKNEDVKFSHSFLFLSLRWRFFHVSKSRPKSCASAIACFHELFPVSAGRRRGSASMFTF